jgi:hypothetical protein
MERINVKDFGERILAWNIKLSLVFLFPSLIVKLAPSRQAQAKDMSTAAILEQGPTADGYIVHLNCLLHSSTLQSRLFILTS